MSALINVQPIFTVPPSYIREILRSTENIYLVYNDKGSTTVDIQECASTTIKMEETTLDLTGNPLEVDLSDVSLIQLEDDIGLQENNNHYPIPLKSARKIINTFNRTASQGDKNYYIFCVCDGTDKKCTLVLGACQAPNFLSRIEIYNKGCYNKSDSLISLENMKQEHIDSTRILNCQVSTLVFATYITFGYNLINSKISNKMPTYSCILYNISWNTYQYKVPEFVQSAEMIVQVVFGHVESEMYAHWEQLVVLQTYARQLKTGQADLGDVIRAGNCKNYMEITKQICQLLGEMQSLRRIPLRGKNKDILNLEHLRDHDLVDNLWNILLSCYNIEDLRICFHFLFEELVSKHFLKSIISDNNKSTIAAIIIKLSRGMLAVPTLSLMEALEYLVELGIEKLRFDYCYILDHFNCLNHQEFEKYWNQLSEDYDIEIKCAVKREYGRVRSTIQRSSVHDCKMLKKINYLVKMHIACEFLVLSNNVKYATKESFTALIKSINEQVLTMDNVMSPKYVSECMLQEIKVKLQSNDVKFLQSKDPVSWNVRLTSSSGNSTVTTIFHHSIKPLFPLCVYNKYDVPVTVDEEGPCYYVSKLANFTEKV